MVKLDIGCGANKAAGFIGVDSISFPGVDVVLDVGREKWPFEDNSVSEARAIHFIEHLNQHERAHCMNELYRVLAPDAGCQVVTPWWASGRAYGDLTHQWPPVSQWFWFYLKREWRLGDEAKGIAPNAPHMDIAYNKNGLDCDFDVTYGFSLHPEVQKRSFEYQQFSTQHFLEAAQDMHAMLVARK